MQILCNRLQRKLKKTALSWRQQAVSGPHAPQKRVAFAYSWSDGPA